jgi:arylsulfatase A-like enzyme
VVETAFTESVDVMPSILAALGGDIPRACDGVSLLPLLDAPAPTDWRDLLHYEYDFRDIFYSQPETALGLSMDESSLCVVQDADYKYVHFAALPPLFFDLRADPQQKGLYLIALSGYADGPARARSQEAGFDAHLPKPPDIQQLEALLLQVARRGVGQVAS